MKKIIMIMFITVSSSVIGQLEIKKSNSTELYKDLTATSVQQFIVDKDTSYAIYYRNAKYKHITDIQYLSLSNRAELDQILDLSLDVILNKTEYNTDKYSLKKIIGSTMIFTNKGYFYLGKRQIQKIKNSIKK